MKFKIFFLLLAGGIFILRAQWTVLLQEDFEGGIPPGWTVVDGNGDGATWTVGTTPDLHAYEPPNFGTQYAYYSDDDAGSSAPAGEEILITPSVYIGGTDSLKLSFSWGFDIIDNANEIYTVEAQFYSGGTWGSWIEIMNIPGDSSGVDTLDLTSYLPADSVKIRFRYQDLDGGWYWAVAVDNVVISGFYPFNYDMSVSQILYPTGTVDKNATHYPVIEVKNTGLNDATYDAYFEIYDSNSANLLYKDTLTPLTLPSGGTDTLNFTKGFNPPYVGWYNTKAYVVYGPDEFPGNDTVTSQFYAFAPPESLIESFEDTFPPFLWTLSGDVNWRWGPYYGDDVVEPSYAYDGAKYASFPSFNTYQGLKGELISPLVNLNSSYGTPRVFFWLWNKGTQNNEDTLKVYVSTDGTNWNLIGISTGNAERTYALDLSAYANQTVQVKFEGISDDGISNIVIDYVKIGYGTNIEEKGFGSRKPYNIKTISRNLDIRLFSSVPKNISFNVYSYTGRKITSLQMKDFTGSKIYKRKLPTGIYIIKGKMGKEELERKIIIIK